METSSRYPNFAPLGDKPGALGQARGENSLRSQDPKWKAAVDFEAMFMNQLLKSMRQSTNQDAANGPSQERALFTEMLDKQYAGQASLSQAHRAADAPERAKSGALKSLAAQIYRSMIRHDAAAWNAETPNGLENRTLGLPRRDGFSGTTLPLAMPEQAKPKSFRLDANALDQLAHAAGRKHGLSPALIRSVIQTESAGDSLAVSKAGAKGLMQLMDSTAAALGVKDSFDPAANVDGGARYLKSLLQRYDGDLEKTLAGYNAGPGAVDRHGGVPPFAETRNYVKTVLNRMHGYQGDVAASEE